MYYGWKDVHALVGGFDEWEAAGYPMEAKEKDQASGQAA